MKRILRNTALLTLVLLTATACTRRVQVESEPNRPSYIESSSNARGEIDITGTYDFVVDMGLQTVAGPMLVSRAADGNYNVRFHIDAGTDVPSRNVRRSGNDLNMDVLLPDGGSGTVSLTWVSANEVQGEVFMGDTHAIRATRRP